MRTTRNRKQEGYVYKRGGWWYLRYRQPVVIDGELCVVQRAKRIALVDSQHKTKATLRQLIEGVLEPLNRHQYSPETVTTLGDFVERVYLPHVKQHKRPSTYRGYRDIWEDHLKPRFSSLWLREVRTSDVQRWLEDIADQDKLSKASLKHIKHFLSGVYRYAAQQDYFDSGKVNPVRAACIPTSAREGIDTHAYSLEEVKYMLKVLPEPAATIVAAAAFTGLRRGELRGLTWESYEPAHDQSMAGLRVNRSVWGKYVTEPKTAKSKAPVPVIEPLAKKLEMHRAKAGNPTKGPIFANGVGKPLDLDDLARKQILPFLDYCADCGQSRADHGLNSEHQFKLDRENRMWKGWHAFRRGLATNLNRLGVGDKYIQAILRHANIATTQNIYIKSLPSDAMAAMKQLENQMLTNNILENEGAVKSRTN